MATELSYDVCPETGIGCVLLRRDAGMVKFDLMPDEAVILKQLAASGDIDGVRTLLSSVSPSGAAELDDDTLEALIRNAR